MLILTETEAAERVHALTSFDHRPFMLGIVGPPGVGKSTLVESLGVPVLGMDGYHYADEHLSRLGLLDRKGAPETFDVAGYISALDRLRSGADIVVPRFDRALEAAIAGAVPIAGSERVVVTEGNYLLYEGHGWDGVRIRLDEVWYLDIPDSLRVPRLVARHISHGRSPEEAARWVREVDDKNADLIKASRSSADAIITTVDFQQGES